MLVSQLASLELAKLEIQLPAIAFAFDQAVDRSCARSDNTGAGIRRDSSLRWIFAAVLVNLWLWEGRANFVWP